jgi:ribose-phosphate pyrophosphokinase
VKDFLIFSGSSHPKLASDIAKKMGIELGKSLVETFPDGEIGVQILENVRGKDVFVVQSPAHEPNRFLMELLIFVDALKRASARSIATVIPYYAYARQDRKEKGRVPITAKLVADLLEKAGVTRVLTMDLHAEQVQGFFNVPVDHLYARPLLVKAIREKGLKDLVAVSPDVGSNKMARRFAEDLNVGLAIVDKRRLSGHGVEAYAFIGDVRGKEVVLVDDICSTGNTLSAAAEACKRYGAKSVSAVVTHSLVTGKSKPEGIDEFYITDSVPPAEGVKAHVVTVANLLAEAIECVVEAKSISSLFKR